MFTRWGKEITADSAWQDYPRPQLVRLEWQNLNGLWQYAITDRALGGFPEQWEGAILVPFCVESKLSGVARQISETQRLWYRRQFVVADLTRRTLLHFGAVDFEAVVWINGAYADSHKGGFDPFSIDISELLQAGPNEIVVTVTDPTNRADQPRGKQHNHPSGIWYTPVTGIWQTVWLEQVPRFNHIEELRITPAADCTSVSIVAFLARPSRDPELALQIQVKLRGQVILEQMARPDRRIDIPIPDAQLWSPQQPTLYDMEVALVTVENPLPAANEEQQLASLWRKTPLRGATESGLYAHSNPRQQIDSVSSYFGLRNVCLGAHPRTGQPTLLLNNEPVFQLGTLDQGWWPDGLQTPPSDEAMVFELEYLKAAGFNTLRKHIKVEPSRYYYHCDRLGILVWQDMPSGFLPGQFVAPNDEGEGLRHGRSTEQYELELQRMLRCLHNHPSVVCWVLHNEGWGQFATARLTDRIRSLDSSRVVNAVSGWLDVGAGDVIDRHDYESAPAAPEPDGVRALVMGEYGGIGWPVAHHLWNPDMRNWGYHTYQSQEAVYDAYQALTNAIIEMHLRVGVCAAIYTQTADVEGEVNGLLTYDREVQKFAPAWLARVHGPLVTGSAH
jgi:beta-galactosidase/beta-glucuronidase